MNKLTIINQGGILLTESRDVAERIGKRHADLLETIRKYVQHLENGDYRSQDFFIESTYRVASNLKTYECYLLTRKGCDMVANKMTGEKGILFTAEYVTEFENMEQVIKNPLLGQSKEIQAIFSLDQKQIKLEKDITEVQKDLTDFKDNAPLFNVDCKELQSLVRKIGIKALGGYKTQAYNDNSLRQKVYQDIQHQIKREFGVSRYEAIKRSQLEKAIYLVTYYELPLVLADEVILLNNQVNFERVV